MKTLVRMYPAVTLVIVGAAMWGMIVGLAWLIGIVGV